MDAARLRITNDSRISAIYYALLQCGYEFYSVERDASTVRELQGFIQPDAHEFSFFSEVRQTTCEVYPYWPRAFMLEAAAYFVEQPQDRFTDLDAYKRLIQAAKNISDLEKSAAFWDWISRFPAALRRVLENDGFRRCLEWENGWTARQNQKYKRELQKIADILALCKERFNSPFQSIEIVLDPIKCVYATDYHRRKETFIFCSGALRVGSVIHEFIHPIVHPVVERRRNDILLRRMTAPGLDASYYLDRGEAGRLNAFEEHMVRKLTEKILTGAVSEDLDTFLDREMRKLARN